MFSFILIQCLCLFKQLKDYVSVDFLDRHDISENLDAHQDKSHFVVNSLHLSSRYPKMMDL